MAGHLNRIYGLDILRAISILIVMLEHSKHYLPKYINTILKSFFIDGVTVFFVLSGYLIGGILIRSIENQNFNLGCLYSFWKRRWLRTVPNYLLVLIVLCLINYQINGNFRLASVWKYFIFQQNFISPQPDFFQESWSLSIEEFFYLTTPFTIFIFINYFKFSNQQAFVWSIVITIILVLVFRLNRYLSLELTDASQWNYLFRRQIITRLDSIAYGLIGAYLQYYYFIKWQKNKKKLFVIGVLLLVIAKLTFNFTHILGLYATVFSFTIDALAILCLLPFFSELKTGKGFIYKTITKISLLSYSMYLLNFSIVQLSIINHIKFELISSNFYFICITKYLLFWLLTILLSNWIYKYFELPIMNLRNYTFKIVVLKNETIQ